MTKIPYRVLHHGLYDINYDILIYMLLYHKEMICGQISRPNSLSIYNGGGAPARADPLDPLANFRKEIISRI